MSPTDRRVVTFIRQEAAARGWSRKRLCAEAHIRQVAMRGRKPLDVEEIARAGEVIGMGSWPLLIACVEAMMGRTLPDDRGTRAGAP